MHILIQILSAVVLFVILYFVTWFCTVISRKKPTWDAIIVLIIINLIISVVSSFFTNPITNAIYHLVDNLEKKAKSEYVEEKYIELTFYNRGFYTGYMFNGMPEGEGILVYPNDDEYSYTLSVGDDVFKALRYEGEFHDGWRFGKGIVYYEGDYRDDGEFYGKWEPSKIVFRGKRWHGDKYYLEVTMYSKTGVDSWNDYTTDEWIEVDEE